MSFKTSPIDANITRCKHTGEFECEDTRHLVTFLNSMRGKKLLVDLSDSTSDDCVRELRQLRPLMPQTAIFGKELPADTLTVPDSYYISEVRWFPSEEEALAWLRQEVTEPSTP